MSEALMLDECDAQLDVVCALEADAARLYVRQSEALLDVWDTAPASSKVGHRSHVLEETAGVLHLHPLSVDARLAVAFVLREHPLLASLMRTGRLGVAHLLATVAEIGALGDRSMTDVVLGDVLAAEGRLGWDGTPAELGRALRRAAARLDPAGTERRRLEQAALRTGVRLRPLRDGLSELAATGGGPQLTAAHRLLGVLCQSAGPQDTRTHGQRQVDALLAALIARAGVGVAMELQLNIPVQVTDSAPTAPGCPPEPLVIATDLTPDLLALLTAEPATGCQQPAPATPAPTAEELPDPALYPEPDEAESEGEGEAEMDAEGLATLEAEMAEALGQGEGDAESQVEGQGNGEGAVPAAAQVPAEAPEPAEGQAPEQGRVQDENEAPPTERSAAPPSELPAEPPVEPGAPARLVDQAGRPVRRRRHDGVPELLEHGPVGFGLLSDVVADPGGLPVGLTGITVRRVCIDPTGQAVAIDSTAVPLPKLLGERTSRRRTPRTAGPLSAQQLLNRLLTDLPAPPPATTAYVPTAAQQRLVRARDTTCTFPGCARRARRCELDHRQPHGDGGPTSVINIHPVCKHHHRLKHDGWTCTRHTDGSTTWTSPRGHHLTVPRC